MPVYDVALSLKIEISLVAIDLYEGPSLGGWWTTGQLQFPVLGVRPIECGGGARLSDKKTFQFSKLFQSDQHCTALHCGVRPQFTWLYCCSAPRPPGAPPSSCPASPHWTSCACDWSGGGLKQILNKNLVFSLFTHFAQGTPQSRKNWGSYIHKKERLTWRKSSSMLELWIFRIAVEVGTWHLNTWQQMCQPNKKYNS